MRRSRTNVSHSTPNCRWQSGVGQFGVGVRVSGATLVFLRVTREMYRRNEMHFLETHTSSIPCCRAGKTRKGGTLRALT